MVQGVAQETRTHRCDACVKQAAQGWRWLAAQGFGKFQVAPRCRIKAKESAIPLNNQRLYMGQGAGLCGLGVA